MWIKKHYVKTVNKNKNWALYYKAGLGATLEPFYVPGEHHHVSYSRAWMTENEL